MNKNNEILFQKACVCLIALGFAELFEIKSLIDPPFLGKLAIFLLILIGRGQEVEAPKKP